MKTFKENFKLTNVLVKKVIKKEGLIKYYLYYIMKVLFFFSIFLSPFMVSKWKLAKEIKEEDNISITGLFESATDKGYFHILVANLIKLAIFISIFIVIAVFGGVLYLIGYGIYYANTSTSSMFPFFFLIPAGVLSLIVLIALPFINVPNSYIGNDYSSLTPGRILKYSFYAFKNGGKRMMFKILLFEWLTKLLYLGITAGIIVTILFTVNSYIGVGISIIVGAILIGIYLVIAPRITLISTIMKSNVYDEIVFVKNSNKLSEINFTENDIIIKTEKGETLKSLFKIESTKNDIPSYENTLEENIKNVPKPEPIEVPDEEIEELADLPLDEENVNDEEVITEPEEINEDSQEETNIEANEERNDDIQVEEPQEVEEVNEVVSEEPKEEEPEPVVEEIPEEEVQEEETPVEEVVENEVPAEEPVQEETEVQTEPQAEVVEESQKENNSSSDDEDLDALLNSIPEKGSQDELDSLIEGIPEEELEAILNIDEEKKEETSDEDLDAILDSIPEKEVTETTKTEEISDSELDELLNSIPEKEVTEATETEEVSDSELDELLNSIPEKKTVDENLNTEEMSDSELDELLSEIPEKEVKETKKKTKKAVEKKEKKTTKKKKED